MDRVAYPTSNRVSDKAIVVTYSRPQLNGRDVSAIVPPMRYGEQVPMKPLKSGFTNRLSSVIRL